MQKESTLKFWDEYHETNGEKEWIVLPTPELFELMFSCCPPVAEGGRLRVLEIGCGTSYMARDFWQYMEGREKGPNLHVRSTDVSQVCVNTCYSRDKDIPNVFGPEDAREDQCGLEYAVLNILDDPDESERGAWDVILDKACLDTFIFRSSQRGESKTYSTIIQKALDNIFTLLADQGVYMLLSPRTKLKALRDYNGFSVVERRAIYSEAKGSVISKARKPPPKKEANETCYMYVCRKNLDYEVGVTKAFKGSYRDLPTDDVGCPNCGLVFGTFRNGEDPAGRGIVFWTREWKNHCIHCKAPHKSKWSNEAATA